MRRPLLLFLAMFVSAFFIVHRLYAPVEERHLERTFGAEYRRYQAKTPRFLDFTRTR